jgi:H+-transporting ATPase
MLRNCVFRGPCPTGWDRIALPARGVAHRQFLAAALASQRDAADAIDAAIVARGPAGAVLDSYPVKAFHPFDPVAKRSQAEIERGGKRSKLP